MGNDHSRPAEAEGAGDRPPDYYELLQISEDATDGEIKISYALGGLIQQLVHHPDKNPERIEEATRVFADLQQAYEILSDPNERAFYDSHRNTNITTTDAELYDHVRAGDVGTQNSKLHKRPRGDPGVRLEQLMRFFDPKLARRLDDTKDGFFSIYRSLFALLASDETLHTDPKQRPALYPSFGDSTTLYAPPPGLTRAEKDSQLWARDFYTVWSEFTTEKSFDWVVKWDVTRGDDRSMRRLMEKENKRVRDDYRKEYIDTIRQLVRFVQHRDPRFKMHQARASSLKTAKTQRSSHSHNPADSATVNTTRSGDTPDDFEEQDWQRLKLVASDDELDADASTPADGQNPQADGEAVECVACGKTFLSEASWINHERSKKHKQAIWRLKREMQAEDTLMEIDSGTSSAPPGSESEVDSDPESESEKSCAVTGITTTRGIEGVEVEQIAECGAVRPEGVDSLSSFEPAVPQVASSGSGHNGSARLTSAPPVQLSKREKRRLREERKKAAPQAELQSDFQTQKPESTHRSNIKDKARKTKDPPKAPLDVIAIADILSEIDKRRGKMRDRWGPEWKNFLTAIKGVLQPDDNTVEILCLGLGKPATDRTAQIQLCLLLELSDELQPTRKIKAFDPVWDVEDCALLAAAGMTVMTENKRGQYELEGNISHLLFLPHCARPLYENILSSNFHRDQLCRTVLLGNNLSDYIQPPPSGEASTPGKKKRRDRRVPREPLDSVLQRLVPHMSALEIQNLPDIALPGFARAFISLAFQWLGGNGLSAIDWETPLPSVIWKDDGELL